MIAGREMIAGSIVPSTLLVALVVVLLWFAVGTQQNIRRGNRMLGWLQDGLPLLGRRTTLRWLGSSAARLGIAEANDPFREAEVVVVLEPRDVGILWAWGRARRRRDFVILRGTLGAAPSFELEALDSRGWTGRRRPARVESGDRRTSDWGDRQVSVRHTAATEPSEIRPLWKALNEASAGVWQLSIRRTPPHLEVHVLPPDLDSVSSERLVEAFLALGRRLAR
jgi:hypothetical protein